MRRPPITKRMSAEVSEEDFDKIVAVTQKSIYWGVIVVMPYLVKEGKGVMMNMGRGDGDKGQAETVFIGGMKGFVNTVI
jgi:NADP-dependent 3-hydroxy acid dehydrogenase YdfG